MVSYIRSDGDSVGQITVTAAGGALLVNGTTVFTISGGPIKVTDLISYCTVDADAAASTLQWSADGAATNQTATTFTGATTSVAALTAGSVIYCNFTTLATAPVITQTGGVALAGPAAATGGGVYIPVGIITMVIGTADTTATKYRHWLRWLPMAPASRVVANI